MDGFPACVFGVWVLDALLANVVDCGARTEWCLRGEAPAPGEDLRALPYAGLGTNLPPALLGTLRPVLERFAGKPARTRRDPRARRAAADAALDVVARYVSLHHVVPVGDEEYRNVPDEP